MTLEKGERLASPSYYEMQCSLVCFFSGFLFVYMIFLYIFGFEKKILFFIFIFWAPFFPILTVDHLLILKRKVVLSYSVHNRVTMYHIWFWIKNSSYFFKTDILTLRDYTTLSYAITPHTTSKDLMALISDSLWVSLEDLAGFAMYLCI